MMEQFLPTTFKYVDKILWCYHSNQTSSAVLSHGTTFSEEFTKKIGMLLNFFTMPTIKSEKIKNTAIFLNWYEALSLQESFQSHTSVLPKKKERKKKRASTYICFVPDHLKIEFIWISVQCLRQFKKQTEVIISYKLIICNILKTIEIQSRQSKPFKHLRGRLLDRPSVDKVQQM